MFCCRGVHGIFGRNLVFPLEHRTYLIALGVNRCINSVLIIVSCDILAVPNCAVLHIISSSILRRPGSSPTNVSNQPTRSFSDNDDCCFGKYRTVFSKPSGANHIFFSTQSFTLDCTYFEYPPPPLPPPNTPPASLILLL